MKIAVVGAGSKRGERGGAEIFYNGLVSALNASGHRAVLICPVSDEADFGTIKETYLRFYDLDLSQYDGVISTKAPSYAIRHPNHICYLVHTIRVFYDMFEHEFPDPSSILSEQRKFIQELDTSLLSFPRTKKIFSIGHEVARRLRLYNGLESDVLHPALLHDRFRSGDHGDYLFLPGRLHRWKRVDLVIRAMQYVDAPLVLKIAGTGEDELYFRDLARTDERIQFLGKISDDEMIDLYADALAVPFVPQHEDYGYVTLEAFKSERPVITCKDSGEANFFVKDNVNGLICDPNPKDIAGRIDYLYNNRMITPILGKNGRQSIAHIRWDAIVQTLVGELGYSHA